MIQKIAVETLTLHEVSDLFYESLDIALPKFKNLVEHQVKKIKKAKYSNYTWVKTYEEFKGANLNFYCQFSANLPDTIVSIGMTHRTTKGLILVAADPSNGGIPGKLRYVNKGPRKWVHMYTCHCCERFAERIMKIENPTFELGSKGIMFSDLLGPVRITDTIAEGIDEIEFQFKEGQAYGYRDNNSKIVYYKTMYSNDMLRGDRISFRENWKDTIDRVQELFRWG